MPEKPIPSEEVCDMLDEVRSSAIELLFLQTEMKKKG